MAAEPRHQIIVASVLERAGRFLLVEEWVDGAARLNQPAGRLEPGEPASAGAVRETLEESGYLFVPSHLVGVYQWHDRRRDTLYLRLAYTGRVEEGGTEPSDANIIAVHWLSLDEILARERQLRSPYVLQCVRDCLDPSRRYPLDLVRHFEALPTGLRQ